MSTQKRAFRPLAPTQNVVVDVLAATIIINNTNGLIRSLRVVNLGTQPVFITFDGTSATTATGIPIPAGQTEIFTTDATSVSAIAAAAGSTLYTTVGEGF